MQRRNLYIEKHYNPAYHKAFIAYLRYGTAITVPYYVIKAASPEHYIWRTQEDNKVRLTHAANNGKVFAWDEPPATGHPGQERNCRCWAEPVMVIIEDLSKVEALIKMTDSKTWPEPPINGILTEGLASKIKPRNRKEKSLYDQYGGEWRPHIDRRHNTHWDYKASGRCSEWLNIPINNLPILKEGWQYVKNEMFSRVQRSNYASNSWR